MEKPFKTILDPAKDGKGIMILGQVAKTIDVELNNGEHQPKLCGLLNMVAT